MVSLEPPPSLVLISCLLSSLLLLSQSRSVREGTLGGRNTYDQSLERNVSDH